MAAMPPEGSDSAPSVAPPPAHEAQRQARYNYLVGRLRGRQITMEEATELFAVMQTMIRASETARRSSMAPTPAALPHPRHPSPPPPAPSASDDLFLVGLLAMGAGAGLLAAMARRLADATPPTAPPSKGSADRRSA